MISRPLGAGIVPAPPVPLECNSHELAAGTVLHRIHDGRFGPCEFNPGLGHSRFAPFEIVGAAIPTAYGATSLECAAFETIFHDIDPAAAFKSIRWSMLVPLRYSTIQLTRAVILAPLFSADLMKLGLERSQLIDTPRSTYKQTQAWSPAIHGSAARPEGIVWVSRRYDQERALILFGDRISGSDLEPISSVGVTTDAPTLKAISNLARRAGIVIAR